MKRFYFLSLLSFSLLTGCFSSNYTVKDFDTKENFHKDFNNFAEGKEINLIFEVGRTLTTKEGPRISNDSLIFEWTKTKNRTAKLPLSEIERISYSSLNYGEALITLQNGKKLKAVNIKTLPDSLSFAQIENLTLTNKIPLNVLKQASYENRWRGIPSGVGLGIIVAVGLIISKALPAYEEHGMPISRKEYNYGNAIIMGIPAGIIFGAITGWLIGSDFYYHFK